MGDIFGGGGDSDTTVTYDFPPALNQLFQEIVNEIQALRPLIDQAVPDVQNAIQQYIQQYQGWLGQSPEFFKQANQQLNQITGQTEEQLSDLYFGGGGGTNFQPNQSPNVVEAPKQTANIINALRNSVNQMSGLGEKLQNIPQRDLTVISTQPKQTSNIVNALRNRVYQMTEFGDLVKKEFNRDPNAPWDLTVIPTPSEKSNSEGSEQKSSRGTSNVSTQGIMNLLNQYIQQAKGNVKQTWDKAIGQAGNYWDKAIGQAGNYWDKAIGQAGNYWDKARQTLLQDIQAAEQQVPQIYEEAKTQTRELTQDVLQDALRNTIRKMALQGLVSQTAGTQAMAEQFRQYEYEPLERLTETEAEARRKLEEQALGYKTDIGEKKAETLSSLVGQEAGELSRFAGQKAGTLSSLAGQEAQDISSLASQGLGAQETLLRDYASNIGKTLQSSMALQAGITGQQLQHQLSLPDIYREIMQAQQQYALTPFELRRALLATLTSSAGPLQQLAPSNVTQSTSGGINPIFGSLVGTAGTLGLFKLFGLI